MPCLLLFLISIPLGISSYCIVPLNLSIALINKITSYVSSLPGAHSGEALGLLPDWGIFLITLGFLWLCIWEARWRYWGILYIAIGLLSITTIAKPDFIFDEKGTTFAYRNSSNHIVTTPYQQNKFLTKVWCGDRKPYQKDSTINCNKEKCIYKDIIEFSEGRITYKGTDIPLKSGGYINIDKGITYYIPEQNRLWNK
jgi:hypothetical protein